MLKIYTLTFLNPYLVDELVKNILGLLWPHSLRLDLLVKMQGRNLLHLTIFRADDVGHEEFQELELEGLEVDHGLPGQLRAVVGPVHAVHEDVRGLFLATVFLADLQLRIMVFYLMSKWPFHQLKQPLTLVKPTRGQWPFRPAATRAMRNRHVMLHKSDMNLMSLKT